MGRRRRMIDSPAFPRIRRLLAAATAVVAAASSTPGGAGAAESSGSPDTVLAFSARCDLSGNSFAYYRIARTEFLIDAGDTLEYDVFVDGSSPLPRGGVDIFCAGGQTLRDSGATDESGLRAHGDADLSDAVDRWVHRKIRLDALAGRVARRIVVCQEGDVPGIYVQYLDNVVVTNRGIEKRVLWRDGPVEEDGLESSSGYERRRVILVASERRPHYAHGFVPFEIGSERPYFVVPLGDLRDRRAIAGAEGAGTADLDGSGLSFPPGELPGEPTIVGGVPFDLPPPDAPRDHVSAHGQVIGLERFEAGSTFLLYFLAASRSRSFETSVLVADGQGESLEIPVAVPSFSSESASGPGFEFSCRVREGHRELGPARLAILAVPVAMTRPAVALRLPDTPDFRVFAATVLPQRRVEVDDRFRSMVIEKTVRTPEAADYLRNYPFARLLPEFEAEEGRHRRLYDLAIEGDALTFRSTVLERLEQFSSAGARYRALNAHVSPWVDLSRPERADPRHVVDRVAETVAALRANDSLRVALSGTSALDALAAADPQLLAELKREVVARRVELVSAAWAGTRPGRAGGEAFVRNLHEGQRFLESRFGTGSRVAVLTLEDGVAPTLPQILRKAGVDHVVFLPPPESSRHSNSSSLGRWEGIDGSRIFAVDPAGHTDGLLTGREMLAACVEADARYSVKHALVVCGTGTGLSESLAAVREAETSRVLPHAEIARVESYFDLLSSLSGIEIPISKAEPLPVDAPGAGEGRVSSARVAAAHLSAAEAIDAVLSAEDAPDRSADWRELFTLLAAEAREPDLLPLEARSRDALASTAKRLAATLDTRGEGAAHAVVNPLAFERAAVVSLPLPPGDGGGFTVRDAGGEPIDSQRSADGTRALVSVSVPGLSARVLHVAPDDGGPAPEASAAGAAGRAEADARRLENRFVRVLLDPATGGIVSIVDKTTGRETVGGEPGGAAGTSLYSGISSAPLRPVAETVTEVGPVRAAVTLAFATESGGPLRQTISLSSSSPEIAIEIDWKDRPAGAAAAMRIPVAGGGPFTTTVEAPLGPVERAAPYAHSAFVDVSDRSDCGIALVAGPGASLRVAEGGGALVATASATAARFSIVPHAAPGGFRAARLERRVAEALVPLAVVEEEAHGGRTGDAAPLFVLDAPPGVLVESVRRPPEEKSALVVRLREAHGIPSDALLRFAANVSEAAETDLIGRPTGITFPRKGSEVSVGLMPFEVQTMKVRSR